MGSKAAKRKAKALALEQEAQQQAQQQGKKAKAKENATATVNPSNSQPASVPQGLPKATTSNIIPRMINPSNPFAATSAPSANHPRPIKPLAPHTNRSPSPSSSATTTNASKNTSSQLPRNKTELSVGDDLICVFLRSGGKRLELHGVVDTQFGKKAWVVGEFEQTYSIHADMFKAPNRDVTFQNRPTKYPDYELRVFIDGKEVLNRHTDGFGPTESDVVEFDIVEVWKDTFSKGKPTFARPILSDTSVPLSKSLLPSIGIIRIDVARIRHTSKFTTEKLSDRDPEQAKKVMDLKKKENGEGFGQEGESVVLNERDRKGIIGGVTNYTKLRQGDYTILPNGDKVLHFPVVDRHPADLDSPFARFEFEYASKELLMAKGKIGNGVKLGEKVVIDLRDDGECDIEPAEAEIAASKSAGKDITIKLEELEDDPMDEIFGPDIKSQIEDSGRKASSNEIIDLDSPAMQLDDLPPDPEDDVDEPMSEVLKPHPQAQAEKGDQSVLGDDKHDSIPPSGDDLPEDPEGDFVLFAALPFYDDEDESSTNENTDVSIERDQSGTSEVPQSNADEPEVAEPSGPVVKLEQPERLESYLSNSKQKQQQHPGSSAIQADPPAMEPAPDSDSSFEMAVRVTLDDNMPNDIEMDVKPEIPELRQELRIRREQLKVVGTKDGVDIIDLEDDSDNEGSASKPTQGTVAASNIPATSDTTFTSAYNPPNTFPDMSSLSSIEQEEVAKFLAERRAKQRRDVLTSAVGSAEMEEDVKPDIGGAGLPQSASKPPSVGMSGTKSQTGVDGQARSFSLSASNSINFPATNLSSKFHPIALSRGTKRNFTNFNDSGTATSSRGDAFSNAANNSSSGKEASESAENADDGEGEDYKAKVRGLLGGL